MLFCLAYASLSRIPAASPEMLEIARTSLARNPVLGLTGGLYFDGDQFYQVLEGTETAVQTLYAGIRRDGRHTSVQTLWDGPITRRRFGAWAMKFVDGSGRATLLRPRFALDAVLRADAEGQRRLIDTLARA